MSEFNPWPLGKAAVAVTIAVAVMPSTTVYCESFNINPDEIVMKQTSSRNSDLYFSASESSYPKPVDLTPKSSYSPQDHSIKEGGCEYTIQKDNMIARITGLNSEAIQVYSEDGQHASIKLKNVITLEGNFVGRLQRPPLNLEEVSDDIDLKKDIPVVNTFILEGSYVGKLKRPQLNLE